MTDINEDRPIYIVEDDDGTPVGTFDLAMQAGMQAINDGRDPE